MKIKVYVIDVKLPRWARRALLAAVPVMILGVGALVHAMSIEVPFTEGQVLTADFLNKKFEAVGEVWTWQAYTPTVSSSGATGTTAVSKGYYRRVGDTIEVNISSEISVCAAGGQLRWSLPPGITPDVNKLPYNYALIGHGTLVPATGLQVYAQGTGSTYVAVDYLGSTGGGMGCPTPSTAATKGVRLAFSFPVSGWTVTGR